ncbi:prolipoprotein diacylglyceryl transferase family protein [Haloferula sargassicola]|uniref:Phosphatidylglycerol--prolipoprotein diacylglyceryl transferase n=1 Tax=Haloferula sargassicola TaxID=490096 RepID=A0ABP9URY3_9BACT
MVAGSPVYLVMIVVGVLLGAIYWWFQARDDARIPMIYLGGLVGAFLGAKLAYLIAEGWLDAASPDRWALWLSGKSITGALPGGWAGVEIAKQRMGYRAVTGDRFALLLPVPLALGRIGCLDAGCCRGLGGWPAVPVEIGFQLVALVGLLFLRQRKWLPGQHFHIYLMAYGLFRFFHEFLRATPKALGGLSGYQWVSLATALGAAIAFRQRAMSSISLRPGGGAT